MLVLLFFALASQPAIIAETRYIERRLKADYQGKVFTVQNFYGGELLRYSPEGRLIRGGQAGLWSLNGQIKVKKVKLRPDKVEIHGNRLMVIYNDKSGHFQHKRTGKSIRIELEVSRETTNESALREALGKIFLGAGNHPADVVPSYWKDLLSRFSGSRSPGTLLVGADQPQGEPYRVGGDTSPPVCLFCPDPKYSEEARNEKHQGTVVLWVIVDREGHILPESILIGKPAKMSLTEQAMTTVQHWRFKPAQRFGKSVAVLMQVEVNFRLL